MAEDLTQLTDTAYVPIFGVNPEGRVPEWDAKAVTLSGYSKEETMGQPLVDKFITEEYKEQARRVLEEALRGTETANFEFPLMTKGGQRFEVLLNATRVGSGSRCC